MSAKTSNRPRGLFARDFVLHKHALAAFAVLLLAFPIAAQGLDSAAPAASTPDAATEAFAGSVDDSYVLSAVEYRIRGFVLEAALAKYLDLETGEEFATKEELEDYVAAKDRLLKNNRVFDLASRVSYEAEREGEEPVRVRLIVEAQVSWTALALPFPKYTSDDGFSIAIRYKDYNFLGTLEELNVTFDYYFSYEKLNLGASFGLYPRFLGANWSLGLSGDVSILRTGLTEPNIGVSLGTSYPFEALGLDWTASPSLSYKYERDYTRHTVSAGGSLGLGFTALLDWSLSTSATYSMAYTTAAAHTLVNRLSLGTSVKLFDLPFFGAFSYGPSAGLFLTTDIGKFAPTDAGWSAGHGLSFGRVDWFGNFRRGASFSVSQSYAYHFIQPAPTDAFDLSVSVDAGLFGSYGQLVGFNGRLIGRWLGTWTLLGEAATSPNWADYARGRRGAIHGDLGFVVNLELPVNAAQGRFFGVGILDAEVFVVPFLDLGYVRAKPGDELWLESGKILCGGLEIDVFPTRARAFSYRLSVGYDLGDYLATRDFETSKLEIWLGLGLFF